MNATTWSYIVRSCKVIGAIFLVLVIIGAVEGASQKTPAQAPATPQATITQDPTLVTDAATLGINVTGLNLKLVSSIDTANSDASSTTRVIGEYDPNTYTIYVLQQPTSADEVQTLSYEYMHYVWQNLVGSTFQTQEGALMQQYEAGDSNLQSVMQQYSGNQATLNDELDSTMCTEIQPSQLSTSFNAYCDKYIPNRETVLF